MKTRCILVVFVTSVALHVSHLYSSSVLTFVGRDGVIGIATRYGLDGPTIESRWGARLFVPVQAGPKTHPASHTMGTGSLPRV